MTDRPDGWEPGLVETLDRVVGLYGQLDALSREQDTLIDAEETPALLELLERRAAVIERLASASDGLDRDWDQTLGRAGESWRGAIRERLASLAELSEVVRERDERANARLEARKSGIGKELLGVGKARSALSAYKNRPGPGPRFQDHEG